MSNKLFLVFFSATYIFNYDNSRFFGNVFIYIYLSYKVYSVIVMVNKRRYVLRLWATPGGLLLSALPQMFLALWEEIRKLTLASRLLINTTPPSDVGKLKIKKIPGQFINFY
jgi:hypothetical protein